MADLSNYPKNNDPKGPLSLLIVKDGAVWQEFFQACPSMNENERFKQIRRIAIKRLFTLNGKKLVSSWGRFGVLIRVVAQPPQPEA